MAHFPQGRKPRPDHDSADYGIDTVAVNLMAATIRYAISFRHCAGHCRAQGATQDAHCDMCVQVLLSQIAQN